MSVFDDIYFTQNPIGLIQKSWVIEGAYPIDILINAVLITQDEKDKYWKQNAPIGKQLGSNNGRPFWVDIPPLSIDELIQRAEKERENKFLNAQQKISLWQTQLQLGMISDADKAKLIEWMHYITALQAVDTSTAPDINWPQQPAE